MVIRRTLFRRELERLQATYVKGEITAPQFHDRLRALFQKYRIPTRGAYLVGERGPEIYVPQSTGRIVPRKRRHPVDRLIVLVLAVAVGILWYAAGLPPFG